jgi:hypothetical protein
VQSPGAVFFNAVLTPSESAASFYNYRKVIDVKAYRNDMPTLQRHKRDAD